MALWIENYFEWCLGKKFEGMDGWLEIGSGMVLMTHGIVKTTPLDLISMHRVRNGSGGLGSANTGK